MRHFIQLTLFAITCFYLYSCSPLKSSPNEEKHQMELTIHEIQTVIDDLMRNYNCYKTELEILDGEIKKHEYNLSDIKATFIEKQKNKLEKALTQLTLLEKRILLLENRLEDFEKDIEQLSYHANESSSAFKQHKEKIVELENKIFSQNKKFEDLIKLKSTIQSLAQSALNYSIYKVKRGDSLDKIAKEFKTSTQQLKNLNKLEDDLIVVGQELKIPN